MKKRNLLIGVTVLIVIGIMLIWYFENKEKTKIISVVEDGIVVTLTVTQKGGSLVIKSEMKNTTKNVKKVTFNYPCNRGAYYHESDNFDDYYQPLGNGCMSVLDDYEMKPNEILENTKKYKREKLFIFEKVFIYPGLKQSDKKIKL